MVVGIRTTSIIFTSMARAEHDERLDRSKETSMVHSVLGWRWLPKASLYSSMIFFTGSYLTFTCGTMVSG